ncbi:MAG: hypothetical protein IJ437_06190 [Clostridia bacterium]|nr:hypothetical protein [Clostridia bacterium]
MKIDKNTIDRILKMNDEQLWKTIQYVAKRSGQESFSKMEQPSDMSKVRQALSALSEDDIQRAVDMMKRSGKNER